MTITDKTRKLLWGNAANRCAFPNCKKPLVLNGEDGRHQSIVGQECHIIAREANGPRGNTSFSSKERDSYDNLILLCNIHHKLIDDQSEVYTPELLKRIKADHEMWVRERLQAEFTTLPNSKDSLAIRQVYGPPFDLMLLPKLEHFIGRRDQIEWVIKRLQTKSLASIVGMTGIGKSALVAQVIQQLRSTGHFPDGIAIVLCQNMRDSIEMLQKVLSRFDPHRQSVTSTDISDLADAAHRLLSGKDALVVLDGIEPGINLNDIIQILRGSEISLVLTSQHTLPTDLVPATARYELGPLNDNEAVELFSFANGRANGASDLSISDYETIEQIARELGQHPLALDLAGAYAADLHLDLKSLAEDLHKSEQALQIPRGEIPAILNSLFAKSFNALEDSVQRLYVALAAFTASECGQDAVKALAKEIGVVKPDTSLNVLILRAFAVSTTNNDMPQGSDRQRLQLHTLLKAFITEKFSSLPLEDQNHRQLAIARYFASYLTRSYEIDDQMVIDLWTMMDTAITPDLSNIEGILIWLHNQSDNNPNTDELMVNICSGLQYYWRNRGLLDNALSYIPQAIEAANRLVKQNSDSQNVELRMQISRLSVTYANVLISSGDFEKSEEILQQNLLIRQKLEDERGQSAILHALGNLSSLRGETGKAAKYLEESLQIISRLESPLEETIVLNSLGRLELNRHKLESANSYLRRSREITRDNQLKPEEALALFNLGRLARMEGKLENADSYLTESLRIAHELDRRDIEGTILHEIGQLARKRGEIGDAYSNFQKGSTIAHEMKNKGDQAILLNALGTLLLEAPFADIHCLDVAEENFRQSLTIFQDFRDERHVGMQLTSLSFVALKRYFLSVSRQSSLVFLLDLAESYAQEGLAIARKTENLDDEAGTLVLLGEVACERNQRIEARSYLNQSLPLLREVRRYKDEQMVMSILNKLKGYFPSHIES